jgi:hypothetical protein
MDSMVLGSIAGAARCLSGARVAESGPVAAVGACLLSVLLKRRARRPGRLVWPGSGTEGYWLWIIWCWGVLLKRREASLELRRLGVVLWLLVGWLAGWSLSGTRLSTECCF